MNNADQAKQHYDRGEELEEQGKLEEAVEEYRAAVSLDPESAETASLPWLRSALAGAL